MMKSKNELYKLNQSRLEKLLNLYQELQKESIKLENDFRRLPLDKLQEKIHATSRWTIFHGLEYPRHLIFISKWISVLDGYREAARLDNLRDNVLTHIDTIEDNAKN